MFGDVEADAFGIRRDAQRQEAVHDAKHQIGDAEGEDARRHDAERLHAELLEARMAARK